MKGCRPLSDSEVVLVLQAIASNRYPTRDRALFLLGLRSGFRISELLSLTLGDVLQNEHFVTRVSVARKHMKKKLEGRTVILHPEAKAALEVWVRELQQKGFTELDTFIFRSRQGGNKAMSRASAWNILQKAYKKVGLTGKLGTHCMRKTFAKRVYEKVDHDLIKTQRALGHKDVNSTVSYLSFEEGEIDRAILES